MKEQIEKLVELAKEYEDFGQKMNFLQTVTDVRAANISDTYKTGGLISIYFQDNYNTCDITFNTIVISLSTNKIEMPLYADRKYLENIYISAKAYLINYLLPNVLTEDKNAKLIKGMENDVEELQRKIAKLKNNSHPLPF